jgi:hypothetical protein
MQVKTLLEDSIRSRSKGDERFQVIKRLEPLSMDKHEYGSAVPNTLHQKSLHFALVQLFVTAELSSLKNELTQEAEVNPTNSHAHCALLRSIYTCVLVERLLMPAICEQTREHEDDEVVETLTAYSQKLQNSLHIINSTET